MRKIRLPIATPIKPTEAGLIFVNVVGLGRDLADTLKQPEHRDKERQVRYPSRGSNHFLATVTTSNYSMHVKDVVATSIGVNGE